MKKFLKDPEDKTACDELSPEYDILQTMFKNMEKLVDIFIFF